jgi:eukaryotic-like serine/threonine-protein kinase
MHSASLASNLEGKTIDKWLIMEKRIRTPEDASGCFSSCYKAKNIESGRPGFLKALNYQYAFSQVGKGMTSADFMKTMTSNYVYERDLLRFCEEQRMSRIVVAIDHGEYSEHGALFPVPYLVFEIADATLKNIQTVKDPDIVWKLSAFHGCLVGLSQLHSRKIVHQDLKPSNILIFGNTVSKLSDLGNATQDGNASPVWSQMMHCGDWNFAPVELIYEYYSPDWSTRRFGADLFMAGGIITYLLTNLNFLALILYNLPEEYAPKNYGGTFEQVKPHIMDAYFKALRTISPAIPESIRKDLMEVIVQLCHPIPEERGNPRGFHRGMPQYSLQRYISIIDRLAKKTQIEKMARSE